MTQVATSLTRADLRLNFGHPDPKRLEAAMVTLGALIAGQL